MPAEPSEETTAEMLTDRHEQPLLAPLHVLYRTSAIAWCLAALVTAASALWPETAACALAAGLLALLGRHPRPGFVTTTVAPLIGIVAGVGCAVRTGGLTSSYLFLGLTLLIGAALSRAWKAALAWNVVALLASLPLATVSTDAGTGPVANWLLLACVCGTGVSTIVQHDRVLRREQERAGRRAERAEQLARKLEAARGAERAASANRANFYAVMSHELRTPLGGLVGLSAVLEASKLDASQREMVTNIRASAEALRLLVNDVLDLEALERGVLRLEPGAFSLRDLIEDVALLFRATASAKDVQIRAHLPAELPLTLEGDALRIRQVVSNLVSNAVKFTERGAVEIRVAWDDERSTARVSIEDSGPGIAPDRMERVFAPFQQTGPRREGGTGLGLSIVKNLVERMQGRIRVSSEVGRGSTVEIELPLPVLERPPSDRPSAVREHPSFVGVRALVVDDDPVNRLATRLLLEHLGVAADVAPDGPSALERLARDRFALVFLDMNMPVMGGADVARAILGGPAPHPHLVALTASTSETDRAAAAAAGMDVFLTKPIDTVRLEQVIRDASGRPTRRSSPRANRPALGPPVLDVEQLAALLTAVGETEGRALVDAAISQLRAQVAELSDLVARNDRESARARAHKLKGTASGVGLASLAASAAALEEAASSARPLSDALTATERVAEQSERAVRAYVTSAFPMAPPPSGPTPKAAD